jgi:hypothetical protein
MNVPKRLSEIAMQPEPGRDDQPIFIFGSPRSGTSLLSRILNAHSRIAVPQESLLYDTFWPIRHHYGDLSEAGNAERLLRHMLRWRPLHAWSPRVSFDHALEKIDRRDFHGIFRAIIAAWAGSQGKPVWGEKSPWHAYCWQELLDGFPKARVLHIIRDPRDASLSWKRARHGPRNIYMLARRWTAYQEVMERVREGWPRSAFHELRYETLLQDPVTSAKKLCAFLGERYERRVLSFHRTDESYETDETNRENLSKPVMRDNFCKWRSELSHDEIRWVESVAGDHMDAYDYERHIPGARLTTPELFRIQFISNPVSRVVGMAQDTQGQREALQKMWFPVAARLGIS